jgi:signal transduction histidine kinase
VRESFRGQLDWFYELLLQAVDSGDPAWLDSVLDEWIQARTQTELESQVAALPPILNHLLMLTYEVVNENLEAADAVEVIGAILPVYVYAFGYTFHKENNLRLQRVSIDLERARLQSERLDKSKSDFIAVAAHELKTPLTLIEGYADMLRDLLEGTDQGAVLFKGIHTGTARLREIVDDMIDVSMIDNQMLSLNYQPVWIDRLMKMVEQEFRDSVRQRNLVLEILPFPGSNEMTFGDAERLYQAFRNIFSNAIKFTPDGGQITVYGRKLPGFVEITVADTGIGVDPENHSLIFEKFGLLGDVSLHSSGKTKFKGGGPGLGLPITKGIIEAHGGAIWVESECYDEDNCPGSIFHVLLPLRKEPPDAKMARLFRVKIEEEG